MASSLLWIALGAVLLTVVECNCPDGWTTHGFMCYFFSHDTEDWTSAAAFCAWLGGDLAEINSASEDHYFSNQIKLAGVDHWIALTDVVEEGQWVWSNSKTPVNGSFYTHWLHGQPDNHHHDENCAYITGTSHRWADGPCYTPKHYVCEKDNSGSPGIIVG